MYDAYGDGWNGNTWVISDLEGNPLLDGTLEDGSYGEAYIKFECPGTVSLGEPPAPVCGDGTCDDGEDFESCADDCEAPAAECDGAASDE